MIRRFIPVPLLAILYGGFLLCASPYQQQKQPKSEPKKNEAAMTGCVDQKDDGYVLLDDRNLTPIANLEADGFPKEGFAKHMGHKVTVRGTTSSSGTIPVFKVRTIETISDTCAPQR